MNEGEQTQTACTLPEDAEPPEPSLRVGSFQLPAASRIGVIGFIAAWVLVAIAILATKWLSMKV